MDKLFDLMSMSVKYQLLCCTSLDGLANVMLIHLGVLRGMVARAAAAAAETLPTAAADAADVCGLISNVEEATSTFYGAPPPGQLALLRHTLCRCARAVPPLKDDAGQGMGGPFDARG